MSDAEKPKSWWQTLPGIITGLAAVITAVTGLIVAIQQTGWLGTRTTPAVSSPSAPAPPGATPPTTRPPEPSSGRRSPGAGPAAYAVALPALRDYKLGAAGFHATFTLLAAEASPHTTEKDGLKIRLRMTSHDRVDHNFWDQSFRLIVDGVPTAPESGLNEVVAGQSAKEGDVIFTLPRGARSAKLAITYYDDRTEIPLDLKSPR